MKTTAANGLAALAALACAGSVLAHHSGYMYQTAPIWISGTVIRFEPKTPHTIMTLEDRSEDGQGRLWAVEGPPQNASGRAGRAEDPKVGDTIRVCAFPYRPAEEIARDGRIWGSGNVPAQRSLSSPAGSSSQFVAGHVMVMPNGELRPWEPHGFIGACIRSSNGERQPWLDLLNANARARELWCEQRRYEAVRSNAPLRDLVEEINSLLDNPCP
jgi:hypothetical protein